MADKSFENVAEFNYLETTLAKQNYVYEEIEIRLNSGHVCYYSVRNLSFRLL
jgi:hypothetical protein